MSNARKNQAKTAEPLPAAENALKPRPPTLERNPTSMRWDRHNYAVVRSAARACGLSVAQFIRMHTLAAAWAVLREPPPPPPRDEGPGVPLLGQVKFESVQRDTVKP